MGEISFLTDDKILEKISELFQKSGEIKCAVAFWGKGAPERLGLFDKNKEVKIICNLITGGSNPKVIEQLYKHYRDNIRTIDTIHSKVYWTKNGAIVGSANASNNGLNLTLDRWIDAAIFIDNRDILNKISDWFDGLWDQAQIIDDKYIKAAKINWDKNVRDKLPISRQMLLKRSGSNSLFVALQQNPNSFKDVYFAIYSEKASPEAETNFEKLKRSERSIIRLIKNSRLDFYENWDKLPDNKCKIIDLWYSKGKFKIMGYYQMPEKKIIIPFDYQTNEKGSLNIIYEIDSIDGFILSSEDKKVLRQRIKELFAKGKGDKTGRYIFLDKARNILFPKTNPS
jgi:hypothetical protein